MVYRTLDINLVSAKGIKQVNLFSKMDVYVVVSITGDHTKQKQSTPVDNNGHTNPSWNFPMKFNIDAQAADQNRLTLVFELRCQRNLGDKDIGEVHVPIKELLDAVAKEGNKNMQFVTYQVRKPSGKPKGQLNFSYKFIDNNSEAVKSDEVVTAYPAVTPGEGPSSIYPPPQPPPQQPYMAPPGGYPGYPPPPQQYGGYPQQGPPPGYGYPPQQGYGYPPQQVQQPPKKNKFGLGLGAGLLGGAIGGLLIGDMVSDGFDGGFDGGFDCGF